MNFDRIVDAIHIHSGVSKSDIRKVFRSMPKGLMMIPPGERVQTPIGTFFAKIRMNSTKVVPGRGVVRCKDTFSVQLKSGSALRTPIASLWFEEPTNPTDVPIHLNRGDKKERWGESERKPSRPPYKPEIPT